MKEKTFLTAAVLVALSSVGFGAINWGSPTYSIALTKAEIETAGGIPPSTGATYHAQSFILSNVAGNLLLTHDPSGFTGAGLISINLTTKAGTVIANDAALSAVADEAATPDDQDVTGLTVDPATGTVYVSDREDTDEIYSVTSAGAVTALANVTAATITDSTLVLDNGFLYYANDGDDTIKKYNLSTSTESVFVTTAAWTAATGGTGIGNRAGPFRFGSKMLIFDEAAFAGSDQIVAVDINTAAVSIYTPKALFGVGTEPGFSTMVVTSDGTIIAWDEFAAGAAAKTYVVIPQGTGTPIRFTQASIAAALGVADAAVDPGEENGMAVIADSASNVQVLFSLAGTGDIAKMTFPATTAVNDWSIY